MLDRDRVLLEYISKEKPFDMSDENGAFRHSSEPISLNGRNEGLSHINFHVKVDLIADTLEGAVIYHQNHAHVISSSLSVFVSGRRRSRC